MTRPPLEVLRSADEMYLARGSEVTPYRPIMTGDVFSGIQIPGVVEGVQGDDEFLAMVVSHPCSMRQGYRLNDRLHMVRVAKYKYVPLNEWPRGHFSVLPLPALSVESEDDALLDDAVQPSGAESYAAFFDMRGRVESKVLTVETRRACLTEEGVAILHQRMNHFDTRHGPLLTELMEACAPAFAEAELADEWSESLLDHALLSDPAALRVRLDELAAEFETEMSLQRTVGDKNKCTLRDDLKSPTKKYAARRQMTQIRKARAQARVRAV